MDSLKGIISDIKVFILGGIRSLPLSIAATMLILGLFTANYSMLFFLLGYLIGIPVLIYLLNMVLNIDFVKQYIYTRATDVCNLQNPFKTDFFELSETSDSDVFSTWFAMITFFIGYISANAFELYNYVTPDIPKDITDTATVNDLKSTISAKQQKRKTQSIVAFVCIAIVLIIIFVYRYKFNGCESFAGLIITTAMCGTLGFYWYELLNTALNGRVSDLFGIANRLISPTAIMNGPIACVAPS